MVLIWEVEEDFWRSLKIGPRRDEVWRKMKKMWILQKIYQLWKISFVPKRNSPLGATLPL